MLSGKGLRGWRRREASSASWFSGKRGLRDLRGSRGWASFPLAAFPEKQPGCDREVVRRRIRKSSASDEAGKAGAEIAALVDIRTRGHACRKVAMTAGLPGIHAAVSHPLQARQRRRKPFGKMAHHAHEEGQIFLLHAFSKTVG